MNRREFVSGFAALPLFAAKPKDSKDVPTRQAKVVKLFKSPDGHPNGLETTREGLWIGEQTTDNAYLVDWNGKVLQKVPTESSNTSGIAFGMGSVWMAANGKAIGRPAKPTDEPTGAVVEVDPKTGKTLSRHPIPGGGGVHGLEFVKDTLWVTSLKIQKLSRMNPKTWEVVHQIPVHLGRAHGLAWDKGGTIWCMHSTGRVIHKLDAKDGRLLEVIKLSKDDPDPHGMCLYKSHLYYCDAGIAPGGTDNGSPSAGYVCRIDF
jgi:sugar lactone lactonase YvrE